MKRIFYSLLITTVIGSTTEAQLKMPAPSPTQTIKQDFGVSSIELTYSRPSLKGRKMIGDVEKYGTIWRTGANAATRIRFNDVVEIGGTKIDTGTYVIYTIPQKDKDWTVIINKGVKNWGVDGYKEEEDVVRFEAMTERGQPRLETFTMQFANLTPISCNLQLKWEDITVNVPIRTNFIEKVQGMLNESMKSAKPPYWDAAQFYYEYKRDLPKALEYVDKAIAANSGKPYWMAHYKAKIQNDMGDKKGATASANQSITWAKEAKNDTYVNMNEKLIKDMK